MRERLFKKPRKAKLIYLVICEGETEKEYVECLKRHFRLPVTIKTKVSGNSLTHRLVKQYIAELNVSGPSEYMVYYVYDGDVKIITDRLKTLPGTAIISNPCIELWFLLHIKEHTGCCDAQQMVKLLRNADSRWKNYSKGFLRSEQIQMLLDKYHLASERARKLDGNQNPSSNMFEFIEILENNKNC